MRVTSQREFIQVCGHKRVVNLQNRDKASSSNVGIAPHVFGESMVGRIILQQVSDGWYADRLKANRKRKQVK